MKVTYYEALNSNHGIICETGGRFGPYFSRDGVLFCMDNGKCKESNAIVKEMEKLVKTGNAIEIPLSEAVLKFDDLPHFKLQDTQT